MVLVFVPNKKNIKDRSDKMFTQLLANYLLTKKMVRPKDIQDALEYKQEAYMKLGVIAVNEGFMTEEQVQSVHKMQSKVDKKFGELAVEMNFLNNEGLEKLLSAQKHDYLLLGHDLINKGIISHAQFEEIINDYKIDHNLTDRQMELLKNNDIDEIVNIFCKLENLKHENLFKEYISLFLRNSIRLLDSEISIDYGGITKNTNKKYNWFVCQNIKGKYNFFTCFATNNNIFKTDNANSNQYVNAINNFSKASIEEFLNLQNGLFLVNMSNAGTELDMMPQTCYSSASIKDINPVVIVPVKIFLGKFDLIITQSSPEIVCEK